MAKAKGVGDELAKLTRKVLRATALDTQRRMKKMTPVGNPDNWQNPNSAPEGYSGGTLRAAVQVEINGDTARIFNNLPYAQRIYLEGHSKQLPVGEFQAMVASIPQRMEAIAKGIVK